MGSLSGLFASLNTGKRSIAVDLAAPDGTELIRTLARRSDVFVENARPGSLERAGLGPDRLHALNPRLVTPRSPGSARPARTRPAAAST